MESASDYFGSFVHEYDSLILRAVPRYREMIARLMTYLPAQAERVLELGCGTGNVSVALAARFPEARLSLVDASPEMLEAAASRLGSRAAERIESTFEEAPLAPGSYDVITSCIALHHVRDTAALVPGGALVYADQMRGRTDAHHAINWDRMVALWKRPGHLSSRAEAAVRGTACAAGILGAR